MHMCVATFLIGLVPLLIAFPVQAMPGDSAGCRIETDYLVWELDAAGNTVLFLDKVSGKNLVNADTPLPFSRVRLGDTVSPVSNVRREGNSLHVSFASAAVEAVLNVTEEPRYFVLSVTSLSPSGVDEMTLLDVPLALDGTLSEPFAACAMALNLQTRVDAIPGPSKRLHATAYRRFGISGASVAVPAVPVDLLRETMKEVVLSAEGLPRHRRREIEPIGGLWALDAAINRGSYLFDFGSLTEETVDAWIDLASRLGFTQIDFHTGTSLRFGDYTPNPRLYPRGRASLKAVIARLHEAGIAAGLHTYAFFIAKDSPYVTPTPDPRLGKDSVFTLSAAVDAAASDIPVIESTADVSTVTGFFAMNSVTLQIGDELIVFSDVTKAPPFAFTGCKRGAHGTRAADHAAGTPVYKLKECFGLFTPCADTTLLTEIAANTADVFNECGFDMIYLDALDGEGILAGHEHGWHYGSKFVFEIAKRLERPALFEMSTFHHHLWYVRARMGAWDHPARAHKRFIDVHSAANVQGAGMFLPMNLGWWAVKTWQDGAAAIWSEPTYPDDIEYLLGKALGHDMSLSLMGVNPDNIGKTPLFQRLTPLFQRYERLRHARAVPESVKSRLRVPGAEFLLEEDAAGSPRFRPAVYRKHKVNSGEARDRAWTVQNPFGPQPLRLRIEALPGVAPETSGPARIIEDFSDPARFSARRAADGMDAVLESVNIPSEYGSSGGLLTVSSAREERSGSWAQVGRPFSPPLAIPETPALGLWVHGDGSGALLNLQLLSARHTGAGGIGDRYITLDFVGWRYCLLVEFESEGIQEQGWPYGDPYSIYREHVDLKAVESLSVWVNQTPPGQTVTCMLGPVKALPLVEAPVQHPEIAVNGRSVVFPVEIPCGGSLEYHGGRECVVYGRKGEELARLEMEVSDVTLEPGANTLAFSCISHPDASPRARVTIIARGDLLEE